MALAISGFSYIPSKKYTINISCVKRDKDMESNLSINSYNTNFIDNYHVSKIKSQGKIPFQSETHNNYEENEVALEINFVKEKSMQKSNYLCFAKDDSELRLSPYFYDIGGYEKCIYRPNYEILETTYHFDEDEKPTLYQNNILTLKFSDTEKVSFVFNNGNNIKDIFERLA